jgi:iron complex outermembrane receptor protein
MKRIALLGFSVITVFSTYSQENQIEKDSFYVMSPVEVKAIRAGEKAPVTKTNLSKKEIEKLNLGQDIPFMLNQTPNVVANSDAGTGIGYTGIRIRGTDSRRTNITLNGIPYNDAEDQGVFFVDLPDFASSANSIQIQRGVGTSSNGAGALGATINFSTNEVNANRYAEFNNSYGSFNTWKNTLKLGSGLMNEHFTFDTRISRLISDGYIDRAWSKLRSLYLSPAYIGKKDQLRLNVILGYEKTYQAWYGVSEADLNAGNRTVNYAGMRTNAEPYENETDNYWQDHYQIFYTHQFNSSLSFNNNIFFTKGKGYYEEYREDEPYANYGLPPAVDGATTYPNADFIRQLWLDNNYYGDIFSIQYKKNKTEFTLGGGYTKYEGGHFGELKWASHGITGPSRWYDLNAFKNDFNSYAKWLQRLTEKWNVFADLQYRHVKYDINGFRDNPTLFIKNNWDFVNPKFGISYDNKGWNGYASYAIAKKEPSRDDFEAGQNQQPRPEQLNDLELGFGKRSKNSDWSATFYYMDYNDQLVLTGKINDVGAYTRTNIPKSYRAGIELQGGIVPISWLKVSGNLAFSKNKVEDFTEFIDDYDAGGQKTIQYSSTNIALSPDIVGAATFSFFPVKKLELSLLSKYVGKQYLDNTQNEGRKLDPFYLQDVRAIYSFSKGILKESNLVLQVNNLLNEKYEPSGYTYNYIYNSELVVNNYYYPMAGTNFMVALNLKF